MGHGQVGLMPLLEELGVDGALRAAAAGLDVGRLAHPASEPETHRWLGRDSGLGELPGVDCEAMGAMQPYRASDALASTATLEQRGLGNLRSL